MKEQKHKWTERQWTEAASQGGKEEEEHSSSVLQFAAAGFFTAIFWI